MVCLYIALSWCLDDRSKRLTVQQSGNVGFSILSEDTTACRMGKTWIEPPTFWLEDDLLSQSRPWPPPAWSGSALGSPPSRMCQAYFYKEILWSLTHLRLFFLTQKSGFTQRSLWMSGLLTSKGKSPSCNHNIIVLTKAHNNIWGFSHQTSWVDIIAYTAPVHLLTQRHNSLTMAWQPHSASLWAADCP